MHTQTKQIAVLLTDKDLPLLVNGKQTLPLLFHHFFSNLNYHLTFYDAMNFELPNNPEQFAACCITGSKFSVLNPEPWAKALIQFIQAQQYQKLIGICYGHQMIAMALGGEVQRVGWHIGVSTVEPENQTFQSFQARFNHEDHVTALPKDANLLAHAEQCQNTLYHIKDKVLSMQFHPEFTEPYHSKLFKTRFAERMSSSVFMETRQRIQQKDDKPAMRMLIKNFVDNQPLFVRKDVNLTE